MKLRLLTLCIALRRHLPTSISFSLQRVSPFSAVEGGTITGAEEGSGAAARRGGVTTGSGAAEGGGAITTGAITTGSGAFTAVGGVAIGAVMERVIT